LRGGRRRVGPRTAMTSARSATRAPGWIHPKLSSAPLASRLSQTLRLASSFRSLAAFAPRRLRLKAVLASFWRVVTCGCTALCCVSRTAACARRRRARVGGRQPVVPCCRPSSSVGSGTLVISPCARACRCGIRIWSHLTCLRCRHTHWGGTYVVATMTAPAGILELAVTSKSITERMINALPCSREPQAFPVSRI
jgi:hypothetical protein